MASSSPLGSHLSVSTSLRIVHQMTNDPHRCVVVTVTMIERGLLVGFEGTAYSPSDYSGLLHEFHTGLLVAFSRLYGPYTRWNPLVNARFDNLASRLGDFFSFQERSDEPRRVWPSVVKFQLYVDFDR